MFRIPQEAKGRRVKILMQNVAAFELKITSVDAEEVIGIFNDEDEEHVNQAFIMSWSYSTRREVSEETKRKIKDRKASSKSL